MGKSIYHDTGTRLASSPSTIRHFWPGAVSASLPQTPSGSWGSLGCSGDGQFIFERSHWLRMGMRGNWCLKHWTIKTVSELATKPLFESKSSTQDHVSLRYPYRLYPKESSTSHLVCSGSKLQINPVPRTKNGEKCWTCAPVGEGRSLGMDTGHPREANSGNPTGFLSHGPRWYSLSMAWQVSGPCFGCCHCCGLSWIGPIPSFRRPRGTSWYGIRIFCREVFGRYSLHWLATGFRVGGDVAYDGICIWLYMHVAIGQ